jgi:hypothetical protein
MGITETIQPRESPARRGNVQMTNLMSIYFLSRYFHGFPACRAYTGFLDHKIHDYSNNKWRSRQARSPSSAPPRGGSGNLPRRYTCPSPVPDGLQSPPGKAKAEQTFSSAAGSAAVFKGGRSHAVPALAT